MAELTSEKADKEIVSSKPSRFNDCNARVRSSFFKYYIHDGVDACRFELLGHLTEAQTTELNGCWRTAKTTLRNRKLVFDLQRLETIDEVGKEWLVAMASEGAVYVPDSFLRNGLAGANSFSEAAKPGFLAKLFSILRGSRVVTAQSSTQAR
jgi:hypothetical protein